MKNGKKIVLPEKKKKHCQKPRRFFPRDNYHCCVTAAVLFGCPENVYRKSIYHIYRTAATTHLRSSTVSKFAGGKKKNHYHLKKKKTT